MATESSQINSSVVKRVLTSLDKIEKSETIVLPAILLAILAASVSGFAINPMTVVAQEKSSNQTEIVVAQTAEEKAEPRPF